MVNPFARYFEEENPFARHFPRVPVVGGMEREEDRGRFLPASREARVAALEAEIERGRAMSKEEIAALEAALARRARVGAPKPLARLTVSEKEGVRKRAEEKAREQTAAVTAAERAEGRGKYPFLKGVSEGVALSTVLFPAATVGRVGTVGAAKLGPVLGRWARPLAEAAYGGAAGGLTAAAEGASPAEIATTAGQTGLFFGMIPGAPAALKEAAAGYGVVGRRLAPAAEEVFARMPALARARVAARGAAEGLGRGAATAALKLRYGKAWREGERPRRDVERYFDITEREDVAVARQETVLRGRLADIRRLHAEVLKEQIAAGEARLGRRLTWRERRAVFGQLDQEIDRIQQAAKDQPAEAMLEMYDAARESALDRLKTLGARGRALERAERKALYARAREEGRIPALRVREARLRQPRPEEAEAAELARDAEAKVEELASQARGVPATRAEAREPYAELLDVLDSLAKGSRGGVPRLSTRWGKLAPEQRGQWLRVVDYEGDVSAGSTLGWNDLPESVRTRLRKSLRMQRQGAPGEVLVVRRDRVVGRTSGTDLLAGDEYADAGFADPESFLEEVYRWVPAGDQQFRWGRAGQTKQFGERMGFLTASEAREGAAALRQHIREQAESGKALLEEGATATKAAEEAATRARGIVAGREQAADLVGESLKKAEAAVARHEAVKAELPGVRRELKRLAWARNPRTRKRMWPIEAKEPAKAAMADVESALWQEAAEAGWSPGAICGMRRMAGLMGRAEQERGAELALSGVLSPETVERWGAYHLRRIVPFFRGGDAEMMIAWLETHGPKEVHKLVELLSRRGQAGRLVGIGRPPVRIPAGIFQPRKVAGPLEEALGAQLVPYQERFRESQRFAIRSAAEARGLRDIAREFSIGEEEFAALIAQDPTRAARYRQVPVNRTLGDLSGRYVEKQIFSLLTDWQHTPTRGERWMGWFKAFHVPLSPAATFHNLVSNKMMGSIEYGMGPWMPENYLAALNELRGNGGLWAEAQHVYPLGAGLFQRREVASAIRDFGSGARAAGVGGAMQRFVRGASEKLRNMTGYYGGMELWDKWAAARWDHLVRGTPLAQAMRTADDTLINYARQPAFVLKLRRSPVGTPFLTFPWTVATKLAPHWAAEHPGKLYLMYKTPYILTQWPARHEEALRDRIDLEKAVMPEWNAPDMMIRLPWVDSDGAGLWLDLSRFVPFADILEASYLNAQRALKAAGEGGLPSLQELLDIPLGMVSPFLAMPVDLAAIVFAGQKRGRGYAFRALEDTGPFGRAKEAGIYAARTALPAAIYDAVKVLTQKPPTMEQPWRRSRALEAVRAFGIPIVRIRPDLEYDRVVDRLSRQLARAVQMQDEHPKQAWYWRAIEEDTDRRLEFLMRFPPPPALADLPMEEELRQQAAGQ